MRYRPQRGGLADSMAEVIELPATLADLANHLGVKPEQISLRSYGFDDRIGWMTWLVSIDGQAVGFTDRNPATTTCIDCGIETKPGRGSARCPACWEDRCGGGPHTNTDCPHLDKVKIT